MILHKAGYYKCNIFVLLNIKKENVLKLLYLTFYNKGNAEDWRNNAGIFWKTYLRMDAETGALFAKNINYRKPGNWRERMKIKMQYNYIEACREICNLCHFESEYII